MKKILTLVSLLAILALAACGGGEGSSSEGDNKTIKVGASSVPHAEILEEAKPLLEEEGINLEIEKYEDYVFPNDDLASGEIDANYFQHIPYLEQTIADTGYELTEIGGIHIEPIGVYSKDFASIDEIPEGTEVLMSNSVPDHGRILSIFEAKDLITLDKDVDKTTATVDDIVENPKNLEFTPEGSPEMLPNLYNTEDNVLVVINTNFAIQDGLNPLEDALILEDEESPYVNVIAVKEEDKDDEALNKLVDVLHSEEIQDFILDKYKGAVVPVGGKE
ncbi:methionine-binding lipoprotein MetQ precursor [Oceanobacillus picturae]|uniref:Lipoprotein n=1 Tax=Oceanobacillus picturae TaxID=171693 RepID=A0A0U9H7F2_9BACI|nr:MetQ/NlpA family ABC transporter substrate-binding protein [Oceanobacillus picturae]GAQ18602.1 methionine-binding lipoprotein MetQ precursor [Oceanobacillus picturae]